MFATKLSCYMFTQSERKMLALKEQSAEKEYNFYQEQLKQSKDRYSILMQRIEQYTT